MLFKALDYTCIVSLSLQLQTTQEHLVLIMLI